MTVRRVAAVMVVLAIVLLVLRVIIENRNTSHDFAGETGDASQHWPYAIDARETCWLRLQRDVRPVIRVNCFAIDGVLHTHSNRFAPIASLLGRSWTQTVEARPELELQIDNKIYSLRAKKVHSDDRRRQILAARNYRYIPDGIQVFALVPD